MNHPELLTEILIVDDDPGMLDLLSSNLRARGYRVTTAGSAGEAVAKARETAYGIVICDLKMPMIDGLACLDLVKTFRPETEFIMVSGEGTIRSAVEAVKKGAVDFLQKPVEMGVLFKLVERTAARIRLKTVTLPRAAAGHEVLMRESLSDVVSGFEADAGGFWRAGDDTLSFEGSVGYGDGGPSREMLDLIIQVAAAAKEFSPRSCSLNKLQRDRLSDAQRGALNTQIRSHLAVPLFFENRFFGVLGLSRLGSEKAFSAQEIQAVRDMADKLAARIAYSAVRLELEKKTDELKSLKENRKAA